MSQTAAGPIRERPRKSLGTALALAFFFGPFGLAYASLTGALVMLAVCVVVLVPILLGLHINAVLYFPVWMACVLWAAVAAYDHSPERPEAPEEGDWLEPGPSRAARAPGVDSGAPGRS